MSTETAETSIGTVRFRTWASAMTAGTAAGVVMGLMLHFLMDLMPVIASLYGFESVAAGWVAHLFHSLVFALIYSIAFSTDALRSYAANFPENIATGGAYGVAIWVFGPVVVMPLWLQSIGFGYAPEVPNLDMMSLVAHLAFGVVVGALYPLFLGFLLDRR